MAKRRRLEVPAHVTPAAAPETKAAGFPGPPPIAEVAGQSAALAAAEGVMAELEAARADGRLAQALPLEAITAEHLVRDRIGVDEGEMAALMASIRAHGQRTPIEVVEAGAGRYGLISGWRRLAALRALHAETGDFPTILAVIRTPADAGAAYVAMVEENEIRVGLSYYERARIAALAAGRKAFPDVHAAVEALYASGSKAKRSKIRSFLAIHETLGDLLRFPAALPERLGLTVAGALKAGKGAALRAALATPAESAEAEMAALQAALASPKAPPPEKERLGAGLEMVRKGESLTLKGPAVTDELVAKVRAFLS